MKFKAMEDVEAPLAEVWRGFTDFARIEDDIRTRGADLTRVGDWAEVARDVSWRGSVPYRGKTRDIAARVSVLEPEEVVTVESRVGGMTGHYEMNFVPLSPGLTRVAVVLELKAGTLSARLLLQTLKLARRRVLHRMEGMLVRQGQTVEEGWRAAMAGD